MKIEEQDAKLFERWENKRPDLIKDGIVNYDIYKRNEVKVLYILKEVNGGKNWDLRSFLRNGGRWRTWNNVVRWQFGLENQNSLNRFREINYINNETRKKYLNKIAVINLKKESGGKRSKTSEIRKYSKDDKEFLKEQIKIYDPDIIICCGTGEIVKEFELIQGISKWHQTSNGINYYVNGKQIIISYYHPQQYRIKKAKLYTDLITGIYEIKNSQRHNAT